MTIFGTIVGVTTAAAIGVLLLKNVLDRWAGDAAVSPAVH